MLTVGGAARRGAEVTLAVLAGDPVFEDVALKATDAVWQRQTQIGLVRGCLLS